MNLLPRRFLTAWVACFVLCAGSALGTLWMLYGGLTREHQQTASTLIGATGELPYLIAVILLAVSGLLASWFVRSYFLPLRIATEATAIARSCNPAYRLQPAGPAELQALAASINALAERHQAALQEIDTRIAESHAALTAERNRLAVLMSELPQSVIVVSADGRILLYNEQARRLFSGAGASAYLGLGRSLGSLLPHAALDRAVERLRVRTAAGEIDPIIALELTAMSGVVLKARIAPMAGAAGGDYPAPPAGFVLLLEEIGKDGIEPARDPERAQSAAEHTGRPVFYDFDLFHAPAPHADLEAVPLSALGCTVFDTETTGLEPRAGDEIISIGAVHIVNQRIVAGETFDRLVDPRRPISMRSVEIHGIRTEMLNGHPTIDKVLPEFHRFCADTVLVGHNVAFDMRFIAEKEASTGVRFRQPILDTLLLSAVLHEALGDDRLEAIAHRFGIEVVARHNALGDALLTAEVFLKMLPLLAERGISTLRDAQLASERTRYARIRY